MKLCAISDLHVGYQENLEALVGLSQHPGNWLILAGDVGGTLAHLKLSFEGTHV
jgi:predicted phosphodiesterase